MHNAKVWRDGSIVFLGISLLILDYLHSIQKIFQDYASFINELEEIRDRRTDHRERRTMRRLNAVDDSTSLRNLLKLPKKKKTWGNDSIELGRALSKVNPKRKVIVAIIDTGMDYDNESLKKFLSYNSGEVGLDENGVDKSKNGIDDDLNGYIDDYRGWDFADNDSLPEDTNSHGTHISGIIVDELDSNKHEIRILPLKFFKEENSTAESIKNTASAIRYAVDMGAKIINYSAGGYAFSYEEEQAIEYAKSQGVLFVSAAGNNSSNNDRKPYYPAGYKQDNILSIGSISKENRKIASSNYGRSSIDLFAPGKDIISYGLKGKLKALTGTSQATAFVSKTAALLYANSILEMDYKDLKTQLVTSSDKDEKLLPYSKEGRKLNAYHVLENNLESAAMGAAR
ncbi:MAG: S8 family peptidase [Bdellovibrionota bacterium]|nr:S8 family peptidase [Bdellovibrionota bacterium]